MTDRFVQPDVSADRDELVAAFLAVRRALGVLGLSLPVALYVWAQALPGGAMQPSISDFYHTAMGDVLVGVLVAIGVFLISYVGYKPRLGDRLTDWWVSTIAGVGAIGVALFPKVPAGAACPLSAPAAVQGFAMHWCQWWEPIHFASAGVFFFCMALFCLFLFPKNGKGEVHWFDEAGNLTYFVCGALLIVSIAGLVAFFLIRSTAFGRMLEAGNVVFWLEATGVLAFAVAWLTKGDLLAGLGLSARKA